MRSVLVTGGTGILGRPIVERLKESWDVYTLQRRPYDNEDLEHWLDADMMEPQQTITAVHQLWNEVSEEKTPPLSAIVHSVGADSYETWKDLTTFDLQAAVRLHVLEPLMLTKYLVDHGVMAAEGTAVWIIDLRESDFQTVPQRMAKAAMRPMVEIFSRNFVPAFRTEFIECLDSVKLGAAYDAANRIAEILQ